MEQTTSTEGKPTPTPHSHGFTANNDPQNIPLAALVEAYPNNFILRYIIVPTALHIWWTLLGIFGLLFSHYRVCREFWSSERVCSSRTHYLLFAVECGLVVLMGYTYYLKKSLMQQRLRSCAEHK